MLLTAVGLGHSFGGVGPLFEDVNFEARPGRPLAVVGPSGSGKSTLLAIVGGWESPTSGSVARGDIATVCWVFQNPHGVARRTALDHVALPFLARGFVRREAEFMAQEVMALFGILALGDREFRHLSGGEAQRLMLARAVATRPDLLLVDEPTAQLDQAAARAVNEVLATIAESGAIILIATHDPRTAAACSEVLDLTKFAFSTTDAP